MHYKAIQGFVITSWFLFLLSGCSETPDLIDYNLEFRSDGSGKLMEVETFISDDGKPLSDEKRKAIQKMILANSGNDSTSILLKETEWIRKQHIAFKNLSEIASDKFQLRLDRKSGGLFSWGTPEYTLQFILPANKAKDLAPEYQGKSLKEQRNMLRADIRKSFKTEKDRKDFEAMFSRKTHIVLTLPGKIEQAYPVDFGQVTINPVIEGNTIRWKIPSYDLLFYDSVLGHPVTFTIDFSASLPIDHAESKKALPVTPPKDTGQKHTDSRNKTNPLTEADAAYNRKDYAKAATLYLPFANKGNARAQNVLGYLYQNGLGVKQDYTQAYNWFLKAADQGDESAQSNLGYMFHMGQGVRKDYSQALLWYRRSAEGGSGAGAANMGYMYEYGQGTGKDYAEAAKWYRKAAELGHMQGQYDYGRLLENGHGVPRDTDQALSWYRKAAAQGQKDALKRVKELTGDDIVTKDQYNKINKQTDEDIQVLQGMKAYHAGQYDQAASLFLPKARAGNPVAQYWMGRLYFRGGGKIRKNYQKAAEWYRKSADQGNLKSQVALGLQYAYGKGVRKDLVASASWYRKAAERGSSAAQARMIRIYHQGLGVPVDHREEVKWLRRLADKGDKIYQYKLGYTYETGHGISKNIHQASAWYRKSAAQGNQMAKDRLDYLEKKSSFTRVFENYADSVNRGLHICNGTSYKKYIAMSVDSFFIWSESGWYEVDIGKCMALSRATMTGKTVYLRVEDQLSNGKNRLGKYNSKGSAYKTNRKFCIDPVNAFTYSGKKTGNRDPQSCPKGYELKTFNIRIETGPKTGSYVLKLH